ncbi:hypothetical protein [Sinomonas sp. G460-2]|uniref:hypothetical protein n=1 Tax=Sinomonas sp. G460-2 TaxID=3393464 RepID=UPI0039F02D27
MHEVVLAWAGAAAPMVPVAAIKAAAAADRIFFFAETDECIIFKYPPFWAWPTIGRESAVKLNLMSAPILAIAVRGAVL